MNDNELFQLAANSTRKWRDMEIRLLEEAGCDDLSYRPTTGMASPGWVLGHQAAVFDFTLNVLIKQGSPKNEKLAKLYIPGTSGDWVGTSRDEIRDYYDSGERELLEWIETASEPELERVIEEGKAPSFFVGSTVRQVISNTFTHLDYHSGHLTAIRKEWETSQKANE